MPKGWTGSRAKGFSLRFRIFSGFLLMAAATAGLGLLAAQSVSRAGGTGPALLDHALTVTSLARSAEAGVAAVDAALLRRRLAQTPAARQAEEERIAGLAKRIADNLEAVADRAASEAVRQAAASADAAAVAWIGAARSAFRQPSPDWVRLASLAATAGEQLEALADLMILTEVA